MLWFLQGERCWRNLEFKEELDIFFFFFLFPVVNSSHVFLFHVPVLSRTGSQNVRNKRRQLRKECGVRATVHIPSGTSSTPLRTQGTLWTHTIRNLSMVRLVGKDRHDAEWFLFALQFLEVYKSYFIWYLKEIVKSATTLVFWKVTWIQFM